MMSYKPGDVILTEVIFAERNETKKRPALILCASNYHKNRQDIIIAAITSNISRVLYGDTLLKNWKEAGLKYPSLVVGIIQTIKSSMIIRKLGTLSKKDFNNVKLNFKKSIVAF